MGAHFRLPTYPDVRWEAVGKRLEQLGVPSERVFATDASAPQTYDAVDWSLPAALVVSNEAQGLSAEARKAASAGLIGIPMLGGTESLNAAMAATIVLFEAARQRRAGGGA
jgi:TrmH family RNA methyltransferase